MSAHPTASWTERASLWTTPHTRHFHKGAPRRSPILAAVALSVLMAQYNQRFVTHLSERGQRAQHGLQLQRPPG
eukprot:1157086-Pelagomonas_calceolata.AAC.3